MEASPGKEETGIRLRPMLLAALICSLLSLPIAWNSRELISSDGLSYLDLAVNARDSGINCLLTHAYWSPVYPAVVALALKVVQPAVNSQLAVVHAIDWIICAAMYFAFTWFLYNLLKWVRLRGAVPASRMQFFALLAIAYVFLFVSNEDIALWLTGPNILMEAMVYLAAGMAMRLSLPGVRLKHYVFLGLILALGYAAKTALFPLSLILLFLLFIRHGAAPPHRTYTLIAGVVFALAVAPLVAILSQSKGRLTFGDSGGLAYAWYVNGIPRYWEKSLPKTETLRHSPAVISTEPEIVRFDWSPRVAYVYWYDPSWWNDGVHGHFDLHQQTQQYLRIFGLAPKLMFSGATVFQLAARWIPLWLGLAAFIVFGLRAGNLVRFLGGAQLWLLLWPASALSTFASVLIEYRYLLPFIVIGWSALFVAAAGVIDRKRWTAIALLVATGFVLVYGPNYAREVVHAFRPLPGVRNDQVRARLEALGIRPGDEMVSVGFADYAYYARMVGARFTFQILDPDRVALSKLPASKVRQALAVLRANGARAVFSAWTPAFQNDSGWVKIDNRNYVRMLN